MAGLEPEHSQGAVFRGGLHHGGRVHPCRQEVERGRIQSQQGPTLPADAEGSPLRVLRGVLPGVNLSKPTGSRFPVAVAHRRGKLACYNAMMLDCPVLRAKPRVRRSRRARSSLAWTCSAGTAATTWICLCCPGCRTWVTVSSPAPSSRSCSTSTWTAWSSPLRRATVTS